MKPTPRALALVAVLALPVAAVIATLLLRGSDAPVNETPVVRIGGADGSRSELPSLPDDPSSQAPTTDGPERPPSPQPTQKPTQTPEPRPEPQPTRDVVPPPPPVDDDDDDDDDDRDDDDDDD
ncbi:type IV secretory pathway VirB10-like protein [Prauserella isguenensis]|uniref:Type IV secretory pathway VirB10-like protein n=1 Tax=Prauserella isguenensis TaxID=1470180 RepID=A0A839S5Y8_9PSEU|nr:hypothetical protein [Prauserella isguenensis]MBB3052693.1 type IV secretory pathway VirB10-like protein [Prauserella isguenensis]